jgi:hypothetical protein
MEGGGREWMIDGREAAMFMVGDGSCGGNDIRRCIWEAEV